jgi:hypothetical protein
MLGGGGMALLVAPGGLIGKGAGARAVLLALVLAIGAGFAWAGIEVARTSLDETLRKLPEKTMRLDDEELRVPAYFKRDEQTGELVDPFLDIAIAAHRPIENADPRLAPYVERIEKSRRRP